jgi:hypothetical protein
MLTPFCDAAIAKSTFMYQHPFCNNAHFLFQPLPASLMDFSPIPTAARSTTGASMLAL